MPQASRYIRATQCKEVDHVPIWLMRQAGRYMKAYRDLRQKYSMMEAFTNPELSCEITLQPVKAFQVDAAIIFSDILVLGDGLNLGLDFSDSSPRFTRPIKTQKDVENLDISRIPEKVDYLMQALRLTKRELESSKTPLIGFSGSPFTVASYVVGDGKHDVNRFFEIAYSDLKMTHALLEKLTQATIRYLNAQIEAGVDALQIFDSSSLTLSKHFFLELSAPYIKKVIAGLHNPNKIPVCIYGSNYAVHYPLLQDIGADIIAIDSQVEIAEARKNLPSQIAVQGNLDPFILYGSKDVIKRETLRILDSMKGRNGFIFNLGKGMIRDIPEDNVRYLIELVRNYQVK